METRYEDTFITTSVIVVVVTLSRCDTNEKWCKNEGSENRVPTIVIVYKCLSKYTKVIMILQYHTRNRICGCFAIHMYHNTIYH